MVTFTSTSIVITSTQAHTPLRARIPHPQCVPSALGAAQLERSGPAGQHPHMSQRCRRNTMPIVLLWLISPVDAWIPGGWSQGQPPHKNLSVRPWGRRTEYDRHLESVHWLLGNFGAAPLPSLETLVARALSTLEIGCGQALALLETLVAMETHMFGDEGFRSGHSACAGAVERRHQARLACAAGLNSYRYSLNKNYGHNETLAARARAAGVIMAGNTSRAALTAMARKHGVRMPRATPNIVLGEYQFGLPFGDAAFDLIYSLNAIPKMANPASDLAHLLDEVLRTLNIGGSGLLMLESFMDGMYDFHPPFVQTTPAAAVGAAGANDSIPFLARNLKWVRRIVTGDHAPIKGLSKGQLPLELVVGTVSTASRVCTADECACAEGGSHLSTEHSASCRRCALAYLFSTISLEVPDARHWEQGGSGYIGLYLHSFEVSETAETGQADACLEGARSSPLVGRLFETLANGEFEMRREGMATSDCVVSALARLNRGTREEKRERMITSTRLWFRNTSVWSDLHVLGPRRGNHTTC